jgi:predicted nucleic acid-binding Zn ribbon protein
MKGLTCVICEKKIQGNHITYMPGNNTICSNPCLIKYRKKRDKSIKNNKMP